MQHIPHIIAMLDASGSMHDDGDHSVPVMAALRGFLAEQRKLSMLCKFTAYVYNSGHSALVPTTLLHRLGPTAVPTQYGCWGGTATHNAMVEVIARHRDERNVMVALFTDGASAAAHDAYTMAACREVQGKTKTGWSFFYGFMDTPSVQRWKAMYPHSVLPQFYGIDPACAVDVPLNLAGMEQAMAAFSKLATKFRNEAALKVAA